MGEQQPADWGRIRRLAFLVFEFLVPQHVAFISLLLLYLKKFLMQLGPFLFFFLFFFGRWLGNSNESFAGASSISRRCPAAGPGVSRVEFEA